MPIRNTLILALLATVVGCKEANAPAIELKPAETAVAKTPEPDTADRIAMAYDLMDGRFAKVRFDSATPVKVVIEFRKNSKDVVMKDWFIAGKDYVPGNSVDIGYRPVDNGELSKARRIRYGIRTENSSVTHLVKNPFMGLSPGAWGSGFEVKLGGKPVEIFNFSKATVPKGAAPSTTGESVDFPASVRVAVYKPTQEDLALGHDIKHVESPASKASKP